MEGSQAVPLTPGNDVDEAVLALAGDLAAHQPDAKVVIFEGADSEFDVAMTQALFPDFAGSTNMISAGNKGAVRRLHELLEKAANQASLAARFFSITDRDSDEQPPRSTSAYQWDVYHIENYLLEAKYITPILRDLGSSPRDPVQVEDELRAAAKETLDALVRHQLDQMVWARAHRVLGLGVNRSRSDIGAAVSEAFDSVLDRLKTLRGEELSRQTLEREERRLRANLSAALKDDTWKQAFRGRDVLHRFCGKHGRSLSYTHFRNFIIGRMRDDGFRPPGMKAVLDAIDVA